MSIQDEIIHKACDEINKKKEILIMDAILNECPNYNLKEDQKRIFPLVARIIEGKKEHYYFNNGTKNGLRLITFVTTEPKFDINNMSMNFTTMISHY